MKKLLTILSLAALSLNAAAKPAKSAAPAPQPVARRSSAVVNPAPDFSFPSAGSKTATIKSLRGQAVVLLIADSAKDSAFKKQLRYLQEIYPQFASKQVVFIAALKNTERPILSNIPFVSANNGPAIAASYNTSESFTLVIIGKDGNIDYQTEKVCTGERIRDVIQNSFAVQSAARR